MADVLEERDDLEPHRRRLWSLIRRTEHLDWLLLTYEANRRNNDEVQRLAARAVWSATAGRMCGRGICRLGAAWAGRIRCAIPLRP